MQLGAGGTIHFESREKRTVRTHLKAHILDSTTAISNILLAVKATSIPGFDTAAVNVCGMS